MPYVQSDLTKIRRLAKRGSYDEEAIHSILDASLIAHVAYVDASGRPRQTPMIFGRSGNHIYLHGHVNAGLLQQGGLEVCACVTLEDGIVLARSGFHSSMNYRSVMVHGFAEEVQGQEKWTALDHILEHVCQGRTKQVRPMTEAEVTTTRVLRLQLQDGHVSAKVRAEGAHDDKADIEHYAGVWAGVIPITRVYGPAENNDDCKVAAPQNISAYPLYRSGLLSSKRLTTNTNGLTWFVLGALLGATAVIAMRVGRAS